MREKMIIFYSFLIVFGKIVWLIIVTLGKKYLTWLVAEFWSNRKVNFNTKIISMLIQIERHD